MARDKTYLHPPRPYPPQSLRHLHSSILFLCHRLKLFLRVDVQMEGRLVGKGQVLSGWVVDCQVM